MITNENVNGAYIVRITSLPVDRVKPIPMKLFVNALGQVYAADKVKKAILTLLDQNDCSFTGVKDFKNRIINAIDGKMEISGADQVYIAGYVHTL